MLQQSYHGLLQISADLMGVKQRISFDQFEQIWHMQRSLQSTPAPQFPAENNGRFSPAGCWHGVSYSVYGWNYRNQLPKPAKRDWLSRQFVPSQDLALYRQLLRSAENVQLSCGRRSADRMNIASQIFPGEFTRINAAAAAPPMEELTIGSGVLTDPAVLADISGKYREQPLSVSRLNLYASCPFRFLCSELYQLEAEEMLSDEITPQEEGSLIHDTLRLYWEHQGRVPINEILVERYSAAGERLTQRVIDLVTAFNRKDVELVEKSGYYPKYLEQRFQDLAIETSGGKIKLNGIIDRIDLSPDGGYVIYDYKPEPVPACGNSPR